MTTDLFSKSEFEAALPVGWEYAGFDKGEETYLVRIEGRRVAVLIRSSVKSNGFSAPSGDDSIRLTLINTETKKPLAKKIDAWTQRTTGWQSRMVNKINQLHERGLQMVNCPECGTGVLRERSGKFGVFYGCSSYPRCRYTTNSLDVLKVTKKEVPVVEPVEEGGIDFAEIFEALENDSEFDFGDDVEIPTNPEPERKPNKQQMSYITAPLDADIRVVAAPGSGKTFSSVERIVYLIDHGVDPNAIVYCTFTKDMATEGFERIALRVPEIVNSDLKKQICTIHALCFRILRAEGVKRDVPKEWQVKQALTDMITGDDRKRIRGIWEHALERPGYKEVLWWINNAKADGVTSEHDLDYFMRHMIHGQASKLHEARERFDNWLEEQNFITFSDMPYMVEQRLINDSVFREKYQSRFTHVLVDEAQDTAEIALRILITLSLEPGDNRVYNGVGS